LTDLTDRQLISSFSQVNRSRLQMVAETGRHEIVMDGAGHHFKATFADTCMQLTYLGDDTIVFHASFEAVKEAYLAGDARTSLLEFYNAG
jgi:hypothetical protein